MYAPEYHLYLYRPQFMISFPSPSTCYTIEDFTKRLAEHGDIDTIQVCTCLPKILKYGYKMFVHFDKYSEPVEIKLGKCEELGISIDMDTDMCKIITDICFGRKIVKDPPETEDYTPKTEDYTPKPTATMVYYYL